jgi:hypothetical protein
MEIYHLHRAVSSVLLALALARSKKNISAPDPIPLASTLERPGFRKAMGSRFVLQGGSHEIHQISIAPFKPRKKIQI